jgi:hypothetical protein
MKAVWKRSFPAVEDKVPGPPGFEFAGQLLISILYPRFDALEVGPIFILPVKGPRR